MGDIGAIVMADTDAALSQGQLAPARTDPEVIQAVVPEPAVPVPAEPAGPAHGESAGPAQAESAGPGQAESAGPAQTGLALPQQAGPAAAEAAPAPPAGAFVPAATPAGVPRQRLAGMIHHVELWVPDLDRAIVSWGWLLGALGYRMYQDWPGGRSWGAGNSYIVVEQSPARTASRHDRLRPGLNHLAFFAASRPHVDELVAEALLHGWKLMFTDKHPYAGGDQHYAAYLENADGYEVELVAAE